MILKVRKHYLFYVIYAFVSLNKAGSQYSADEKLNIISDRGIAVLKVGEKHVLYCVSLEPGLQWVDPTGAVVSGQGASHRVHAEEATGQLVLIFEDPRLEDRGNWTCKARSMERSIRIYVVEKARFKPQKRLETPQRGGEVTLACAAEGDPTPRLGWYFNGTRMTDKYNPQKYDVWEGRLVMRNLRREDSGEYECRARQSLPVWNHTSTQVVTVRVRHGPIMKHPNTIVDVYVFYDNIHVIRCAAEAFPRASFRWSHRTPRGEVSIPTYSRDAVASDDGAHSDLVVRVNGQDDLGDYICYAKNPHGKNKTIFHLMRARKPNPPGRVEFRSSKSDSFLFDVDCGACTSSANSAARPGAPVPLPEIAYRFELVEQEYIRNEHIDPPPVYWEDGEGILKLEVQRPRGEGLVTVSGLKSNTSYRVRVANLNLAGPSDFVELKKQFRTLEAGSGRVKMESKKLPVVFTDEDAPLHIETH